MLSNKRPWWQTGIILQIYPRSFQDSDGDGVGDLRGIIQRLGYIQSLGVEAIWISPIYPSPMRDFGYDISKYRAIHPLFGTMEDFDALVKEAHDRGIRILLDLVPSHCSDQHPWFVAARSSRDDPYRDWFIWSDPGPDGGPPNNWLSRFGGSGWDYDAPTRQYFYHSFLKEQPDLNWRNPQVRAAMFDVMRFWLDRGVDGFRIDVVYALIKDELLRDDPPNPRYKPGDDPFEQVVHIYSLQRPEVHDVLREMRAVLDSYSERVMVGESFHLADELAFIEYYGENGAECHLPFNFRLILMPWKVEAIRGFVERYEAALPAGAWPNWVLGNHDGSRLATRVGLAQARVAQMLLLTLRGTPTCYYGDEIGMTDVCIHPGRVQDPFERLVPGQGRDPARTPMQWDSSPNAGFSRAEPWLPLAGNYREVNVAVEDGDPSSMLALFRHLTHLRRTTPALTVGSYVSVETQHSGVYAYLRQHERERVLVVLNLRSQSCMLDLSDFGAHCQLVLSTRLDRAGEEALGALQLRPDEGIIARLEG